MPLPSSSVNQFPKGHAICRPGSGETVFTVNRYLAKGAFGEVYCVTNEETQRRSALKRIRFERLRDSKLRADAEMEHLEEAGIMLSLDRHRHVMPMEYCVIDGSEFLMFLELVDGATDLRMLIKSGELYKSKATGNETRAFISELLCQAAAGIAFVNKKGVLHQDVRVVALPLPPRASDRLSSDRPPLSGQTR
jgi:serine/threonine protein kinase